jgi:hypothetical protein
MTTYAALIKIGRLVTADVLHDLKNGNASPDRFYARGALQLLRREGVPVVVDHSMDCRIGVVHGLVEFEDTDGCWVWARARITDPPPWLRKGTRCSFGSLPIHRGGLGWIHSAFVKEVSVLSANHEPVESRAHVARLERETSSAAGVLPSDPVADEVIHHAYGSVIRRPVGQVLGVR